MPKRNALLVASVLTGWLSLAGDPAWGQPRAIVVSAERVHLPGVVHGNADPKKPGDIDCNNIRTL